MSITKDFSIHCDSLTHTYPDFVVESLLAHARALEAMLKKHEWSEGWCRECRNDRPDGHAPDCALARLLNGAEASD